MAGMPFTPLQLLHQLPPELQQGVWSFIPELLPAIAVNRESRDTQLSRTDRCLRVEVVVNSGDAQGMEAGVRALHRAAKLRAALPAEQHCQRHQRMHLAVKGVSPGLVHKLYAPLHMMVSPTPCQAALTELTFSQVQLGSPKSTLVTLPNVTKVVMDCCEICGQEGIGWLLDMLPAVEHVHVRGCAWRYYDEAGGMPCSSLLGDKTRPSITLLDMSDVLSNISYTELSGAAHLVECFPNLQALHVGHIDASVIRWLMESSQLQQLCVQGVTAQAAQGIGSSNPASSTRDAARSPLTVYSQWFSLSGIDALLGLDGLPKLAPSKGWPLFLHLDTHGLRQDFAATCRSLRERQLTFTGLDEPDDYIRVTTDNRPQAAHLMSTFFNCCSGLSAFTTSLPTQEEYQRRIIDAPFEAILRLTRTGYDT